MDRNELLRHIQQCEKLLQRNKRKRCFRTVLFYTVVLLMILLWLGLLGDDIVDWLVRAVFCFIFSFFSFFINLEIFNRLLTQDKEEAVALEYLKKRLREKEQEDNHKKEML